MSDNNTGSIVKRHEDIEIEWKIPDFFLFAENKNLAHCPHFSFAGMSWYFSLFPKSNKKSGYMSLYLNKAKAVNFSVEYTFCLKKLNGSVEFFDKAISRSGPIDCDPCFVNFSELQQRKSDLVPSNVLIIMSTLKRITDYSHLPRISHCLETSKLIKLGKLSANFKDLYADKETCDVTLKVKEKEFKAHRQVLMARSKVFSATFRHETLERNTGVITILDCDPDSFQEFLEYLYSGELEELSFRSALNLYYTSDKYDVEELKVFCTDCLKRCLTIENVSDIAVFADKYDEARLFSEVQDFFNKNYIKVFLTSQWKHLLKNDCNLADRLLTGISNMKLEK